MVIEKEIVEEKEDYVEEEKEVFTARAIGGKNVLMIYHASVMKEIYVFLLKITFLLIARRK